MVTLARPKVADVRLAFDRRGEDRCFGMEVTLDVVEDARRRIVKQAQSAAMGIVEEGFQPGCREVGIESCERIAHVLAGLAHDGRARNMAERIEGYFRAITIRIGQQPRREHPIIELGPGGVAHSVNGLDRRQIVWVEADSCDIAERVAVAMREEEMPQRIIQFMCGATFFLRGIEDTARWNPPIPIPVKVGVAALVPQHFIVMRK